MREGYILEIPYGPGIYAGKTLVKNNHGKAQMLVLNATNKDIDILIPPVELEEFVIPPNLPRTNKDCGIPDNDLKHFTERFKLLSYNLNLQGLNEEEKDSLLEVFSKYPYQFHLPGDKLGATNILRHKINITDDN